MYSSSRYFNLCKAGKMVSHTQIKTVTTKSHYDVLGITPKSTQSEVKAAYYKLSKVYHPDKNQGSEDAATKFRDITTAYEVLGNVKSRRMYDRGVGYDHPVYRHPAQDDDPKTTFYRSREFRHRPPSYGRTPIYDFDEWTRAHYGATFAKDRERRRREMREEELHVKNMYEKKIERFAAGIICFIGLMVLMTREDYDRNKLREKKGG